MRQIILNGSQTSPSNTNWTGFGGQVDVGSVEAQSNTPWMVAGTFRDLKISLLNAPGTGTSWTITVYKNSVATSMSVTIADTATTGEDLTNEVSVAVDDLLELRWVATGGVAASTLCWYAVEFESTTAAESGYAQQPGELIPDGGRRTGVFWACYQSSNTWTNVAGSAMENVVPTDGTITAYGITLSGAPGSGKSFDFHIYLNGVKQDGAGATVNTTLTLADLDLYQSTSFSLPVSAGDRVYIEATPINTPTQSRAGVGVRFVADTDGESIMGGWVSVDKANSTTHYGRINGFDDSWESEANAQLGGPPDTTCSLSKFYARSYTAPGGSATWTLTVRNSAADTDLEIALTGATQQDSDLTGTVSVTSSSLLAVRVVPTSSPTEGKLTWSAVQTQSAAQIIGTTVFGTKGTVTSSRTFLANLDNTTRTVSAEGSLVVGGNVAMIEQATAPAGIANMALIFAEDNGSGKTRLMVQFGSGAAQQIAIEP